MCRKIQKNIFKKSNCKLGVDFNEFTLVPRTLELDYATYTRKNQEYDIRPMIGFDNWVSIEESTNYAH